MRSNEGSTAVAGDRNGVPFEELYRRCAGDVWGVARSVTGNDHDASDAVSEAVSRVYQGVSSGRIGAPDAFRAYLLTATRNAAVDILRRSARTRPAGDAVPFDRPAAAVGPSDRAVADEDSAVVARAFAELPPRWRSVLWLIEVEDLRPREAAGVLGLSPNTVSQLAARARARLTERYLQAHLPGETALGCRPTVERLGAYAAGQLPRRRADAVAAHLDGCAACRSRLEQLDDLGVALRRAVLPFPLLLAGAGTGWRGWLGAGGRTHQPATAGPSRVATGVAGRTDARVTDLVGRVASSPVAQGAAGVAVTALVAAVVAGVVTADPPPDPPPRPVTLEVEAPAGAPVQPAPASTVPEPAPAPTTTPPAAAPAAATARAAIPPPALAHPVVSTVAEAVVPVVEVSDVPGGEPTLALAHPQPLGAPLVLLVQEQRGEWLNVLLPVRRNGSAGWVHQSEVTLSQHQYQIVVELGAHRITVFDGTAVLLSETIGVGTADAPTPDGLYYTTALVEPTDARGRYDPDGPYGPYAYPLSGFSDVLFDFAGGDGRIGIHGTNDPSGLGTDVSHGCIRMSNDGITLLAGTLPLGVPVEVRA